MLNRNRVLTNDDLQIYAPSVFTDTNGSRVSDRYTHISTLNVIDGLRDNGFMPVWAAQSSARLLDRKLHTKHMLRFRHANAVANDAGLYPELVLVNSHDGLSSYRLMAGLFRIVCMNGLIAGDRLTEVKVRHQGNILDNVIEGSYTVMDSAQKMLEHADSMSSIILTPPEKKIFAQAVHEIRFDGQSVEESGIKPEQFLNARRYQENGKDDLFSVFNVAQENVIRGGLRGYAVNDKGRYRLHGTGERVSRVTTREVKAIDKNTALNRALWTLAEKMAELKTNGHLNP